jgi:hypothetical protein
VLLLGRAFTFILVLLGSRFVALLGLDFRPAAMEQEHLVQGPSSGQFRDLCRTKPFGNLARVLDVPRQELNALPKGLVFLGTVSLFLPSRQCPGKLWERDRGDPRPDFFSRSPISSIHGVSFPMV